MTDTAVDFLLEKLKELINCDYPWICDNALIHAEKDKIKSLYEELGFLRTFLKDSEVSRYEHEEVRTIVMKIGDVAYEAEDITDSFVLTAVIQKDGGVADNNNHVIDSSIELDGVMEEIRCIKAELTEIYDKKIYGIGVLKDGKFLDRSSSKPNNPIIEEEVIVGFDEEAMEVVHRLSGDRKQLDIISIVGMAGLGKTTLARKVYNDPLITYHFHIRAWVCVSQTYQRRDLLLGILKSAVLLTDQIDKMSEEKLCGELYKRLKGKRYLIVIDDIWQIGAWDDLRRSFPDDNNGSRIMLTSRLTDVCLHAKPDRPPLFLRFLTEEESWDLLQKKVFREKSCPRWLIGIGKQIAKKCQGLPLAVVVIAGILANRDRTPSLWMEVAESVSSYIVSDPKEYMDTLALSYNHLPHHLKACFLYLGAFPEDYEIPVRKLVLLWVAEGFMRKNERKSLEEVAEDCLMDLVDRSLLIVAQKRSDGGFKACRIHDLLRDLCLRKANEENFLLQIYNSYTSSIQITNNQRRLCIHSQFLNYISSKPATPHVRTILSFAFECHPLPKEIMYSFINHGFQLLRVLDLRSIGISISFFPSEVERLVHLRYLALRAIVKSLPSSIYNLWNLETLIVTGISADLALPYNIGKMVKLRHLYIKRQTSIPHILERTSYDYPFVLSNLQTISTLLLHGPDQQVLSRIPNIRKLGCIVLESWNAAFPKLDILSLLENLKLHYRRVIGWPVRFPLMFKFPPNLKKLTLSGFRLPWTEISTIGRLPNLEILKLQDEAFKEQLWDTSDGEFPKLKYLKLQDLSIQQWHASSIHFPCLRRLVLVRCKKLEEIPYGVGYISTLDMIEVKCSSDSAARSAMKIQQEQQSEGNDGLKIVIYLH